MVPVSDSLCLKHAEDVLKQSKVHARKIYRVDPDRIAYVNAHGVAKTALLWNCEGEPALKGILMGWPI